MSLTLSFRRFGYRLNRSAHVMMMFAFTPNSMFDRTRANIMSRFSWQIFGDTHIYLQSARIAERSKIHRWGALKTLS